MITLNILPNHVAFFEYREVEVLGGFVYQNI